MAYEKTNWVDNETPINAENLNKMEEGIVEASKTGGILAGSVVGWNEEEIPEGYEETSNPYQEVIDLVSKLENSWGDNGQVKGIIEGKKKTLIFSIRNGTNAKIMTLPQELKPSLETLLPASSSTATGYVSIQKDGTLSVSNNIFTSGAGNIFIQGSYI